MGKLRIAVPKGSLFPESVAMLEGAGLDCSCLKDPGRTLRFETEEVEFMIVRPSDAPIFAAYGGADCAISGKDSVEEAALDVVEMADLQFGGCRFVVAEPADRPVRSQELYMSLGVLKVATKYPRITKSFFDAIGTQVEIVMLHGNVELAPLIGMTDCIVDITATGNTLRENNLTITADVMESTARFIANPVSARTDPRIADLAAKLDALAKKRGPAAPIAGSSNVKMD